MDETIVFDLWLIGGIVLLMLAVPAFVSAWSDRQAPRFAALMILLGGGMIFFAFSEAPGGYDFADVPEAFIRVFAWAMR